VGNNRGGDGNAMEWKTGERKRKVQRQLYEIEDNGANCAKALERPENVLLPRTQCTNRMEGRSVKNGARLSTGGSQVFFQSKSWVRREYTRAVE